MAGDCHGTYSEKASKIIQSPPLYHFCFSILRSKPGSAVAEIHVDNSKALLQCQVYSCRHVLLLIDIFYKLHVSKFSLKMLQNSKNTAAIKKMHNYSELSSQTISHLIVDPTGHVFPGL